MGTEITLRNEHLHKKGVVKGDGGYQTLMLHLKRILASAWTQARTSSCASIGVSFEVAK